MGDLPLDLVNALAPRYRLDRKLGQGGMAIVYLAHDLNLGRDVALKVLRPELAALLGRDRFLAEIRLTAKLDHPHILTLLDSGESQGFLWYTLPYIRGESLRQRLSAEKQLPLDEALRLTEQVASALDHAHHQGIIHRDVKPENILLHEGEAMLADFGIALAIREAGGERLTETGLTLGTPQYMSPEQAVGDRRLDARSDIYSLAAVLYEMLAGEPPHTGASAQAVIARVMTVEPVPLRVLRATVPECVDAAVARALAKVPADRFGSAEAFVRGLHQQSAVPHLWTRASVRRFILIALSASALLVLYLRRPYREPPPAMMQRQLTFTGRASQPALSPDGKVVAYLSSQRSLRVQRVDGGEPIELVPRARALQRPRWTLDGSAILFWMLRDSIVDGRMQVMTTWMVPSAGGPAHEVLHDQAPFDAGSDSNSAVWAQRDPPRLEIVQLVPFKVRASIPVGDTLGEIREVAWSPDRKVLAFRAQGIFAVPSAGGTARRLAGDGWNLRWARSGNVLYFLTRAGGTPDLMRVGVNTAIGQPDDAPERVTSLPTADAFDLAPDGLLVHTQVARSAQAVAMALSGGSGGRVVSSHPVTEGTAPVTAVAITGDGSRIAYSREAAGRPRIEVVPFDGGVPQAVVPGTGPQEDPSWSPDGTQLAFTTEDAGGPRVMVMPYPAGTPQPVGAVRPGQGYRGDMDIFWSADGARLGYQAGDQKRFVLVNTHDQSEQPVVVPDTLGTAYMGAALSPEGRQLVASTFRTWSTWGELWLNDASTKAWRHLREPFGESTPLLWTGDQRLFLANQRVLIGESGRTRLEVWGVWMPDGTPRMLAPLPDGCDYSAVSISADGRRAVCVFHADQTDLIIATGVISGGR